MVKWIGGRAVLGSDETRFLYRVGEGSRSRNGGGAPKEGEWKCRHHRKSGSGGKWVGSWKVLSPATADGTRVGGGRRGKGKGSGGSRQVGCRVTSGSEVNSYPLAATAGEPKTTASDLHSESGVGWNLSRVEGLVREPQRRVMWGSETSERGPISSVKDQNKKINFLAKANINILRVVNKPNTIQIENGHENSKSGHSTSNKNKQIRSRVPSLWQSIQANKDEEGSQGLSDIKSGRNVAVATTGDYLGNLDLWVADVFE